MTKFKSKSKSKEGPSSKNTTETEKDDDDSDAQKNTAETEKEDDDPDAQKSSIDSLPEQPRTKSKGRGCTWMGGARALVTFWFAFSLIYNMLSVALIFFIHVKFGGQPPTSYYQWGAIVSIAVSFLSMTASILAIIIVDFCKLTVCPFECFSGTAIIIMVMAIWGVCSIGCCATSYAYGDAWMDPESISKFTKEYYAKNGQPPPFLDTLQKRFGGLCCGGVGFGDYGQFNGNVSYIHLPASCCLKNKRDKQVGPDVFNNQVVESANTPLRRTGRTCGTYQWVPFYLAMEEFLKYTIQLMDGGTEGKSSFLKALYKRSGPYMIDRYEKYNAQMVKELSNRYKKERPQAYKKLNKDAQNLYPGDPTKQKEYIKNIIEKESVEFVASKREIFLDTAAVSKYMVSVPYGCGEMISFILFSEWIGGTTEGEFSDFRNLHGFIFWGLLIMAVSGICFNLTNISLFTYGVAIPRPLRDDQDNEGKRKGSAGSGGSAGSDNVDEKGMTVENEDGSGDKNGDNKALQGKQ